MKKLIFFALGLFLVGCTPTHYTREEYLAMSTRIYEHSEDEVLSAAQKVFEIPNRGRGYKFVHQPHGLKAVRYSYQFLVNVWYHWNISCTPEKNGTKVHVYIESSSGGYTDVSGDLPHQSPSVLDLFFKRLDYVLGKSDKWISCHEYAALHPDHSQLIALCPTTVDPEKDLGENLMGPMRD